MSEIIKRIKCSGKAPETLDEHFDAWASATLEHRTPQELRQHLEPVRLEPAGMVVRETANGREHLIEIETTWFN